MMPSYLLSGIPGAMYYAYYYTKNCGQVPEMFAGEGPFLELLKESCPIFKEEYRPPPLMHESRLMTIVASLGRHRGLSYPYMREVFETTDGAELALDWWDARLKPESPTEVPVVPSSLLDSLSHYYNSLPQLRLPQLQIPTMRIPAFHLPYFGPLKRSASATGLDINHLESLASDNESHDSGAYSPRDAVQSERALSPDQPFFDSDDGASDVASDIVAERVEKDTADDVASLESGNDMEFGLEDLEVAGLILADRKAKEDGDNTDPAEMHSTLFESLSYYYNHFLPHLRMPQLQIPNVMSNFKPFSPVAGEGKRTVEGKSSEDVKSPEGEKVAESVEEEGKTSETENSKEDEKSSEETAKSAEDKEAVEEEKTVQIDDTSKESKNSDEVTDVAAVTGNTEVDGGTTSKSDPTAESESVPTAPLPASVPEPVGIVLILPGITGDSSRNYVQGLVQVVEQLGYTAVVMNYRGATGNLKACFMADTTDIAQVIRHLKQRYPTVPILAIGVSLGGILLTNYLARCGREKAPSQLLAVMTVSVAWNFFESAKALEEPLNWLLFNRMLTRALCDAVQKNSEILETAYDLKGLQDVRTLRQFDNTLTAKMFGYENADEYYKSVTLHDKIPQIRTPLFALNAGDDVFSPYSAIPKDITNPNVAILVTSHGGHIGFLEGRNPFGTNYVERVFQQFAKAIFDHREQVEAMSCYDDLPAAGFDQLPNVISEASIAQAVSDVGLDELAKIASEASIAPVPEQIGVSLV